MKKLTCLIAAILLLSNSGCALWESERHIVRIPRQAGSDLGLVAGLPISIVAWPITIPIAMQYPAEDDTTYQILFAPSVALAVVLGTTMALPTYALFGWWGQGEEL